MRIPQWSLLLSFNLLLASGPSGIATVGVSVIPDNGPNADPIPRLANSTGNSVSFWIKNTGTIDTKYGFTCTRFGNVTTITTCPGQTGLISNGDSISVAVQFSVGGIGTGRVELKATAVQPTGANATGGWDITIIGPTQVFPKDSLATVAPSSSGNRAMFRVKNNRSSSATFTLSKICTGTSASCSNPSPASLTIPALGLDSSLVTYSASSVIGDTGHVDLVASTTGVAPDTGSVRVVVTNAMTTSTIDAVSYNPGRVLPREQCLAIAIGDASAAECGDLRTIYQLPMFRVMNVERRPTLLYNSATAQPVPEVEIKVTIPALTQLPDYVEAVLKVGATVRGRQRWIGGTWNVQGVPRFIRVRDTVAPSPTTGLLNYTVEVSSIRNGFSTLTASTSQQVLVVNRQASPYGNGWWIAGLEQLITVAPDTLVWVGGDGSAKVYARPFNTSGPWTAPSITYPDNIVLVNSNRVRLLPDSVWVWFGSLGRHDSTRNRLGHVTSFAYDGSGRVQTIKLPKPLGGQQSTYTFSYGSSYYIVTEGWRPQTTIWQTGGRIDSIIGPRAPLDAIRYSYLPGTNLMLQRTDRRGAVLRFDLDAFGKVRGSRLGPNGPGTTDPLDSINVALIPAEALGVSTTGSVDSVGLHTSYDGPRRPPPAQGGVLDTTAFWVNRFGAPTRIINAFGDSTRLDRSTSFPGLVTRLKTVTGQIVLATYDTRGRLLTATDSTFALATTTYQWDTKWDQLTLLAPPENDSLFFTLGSNGDRISQRDVRGASSQVNFSYDAATRQVNLITGPGTSFQGFSYDLLGDLAIAGTQNGYQQKFIQDNIGRTVRRDVQIDVGATKWLQDSIAYDKDDRDSLTVTRISTSPTDSQVVVRKYFDPEGNLDSLARRYKTPSGMQTLTTIWLSDLAGRRILEKAPDGQIETYRYDSGSNDTSATNRRGDVMSMGFDALNRLTRRVVPQYVYTPRPAGIAPPSAAIDTFAYTAPRSADTLSYAADGQVKTAVNRFARVARQYNVSGLLLADSLYIQKVDTSGYGSHVYVTKYQYDRNRRRVSLIVPRLFKGPVTDTMRFSYYPWGGAYQTQDVSGLLSAFLYNPRSELMEVIYPGSIVRNLYYDGDGNYAWDNLINLLSGPVQGKFPRVPNANLRDQRFTSYDARGKLLASSDTTQFQDQVTAKYSDLGYLTRAIQAQKGINGITGNLTVYVSVDSMVYDALGNLMMTIDTASGSWGLGQPDYSLRTINPYVYQAGTGRLVTKGAEGAVVNYSYDTMGQIVFESREFGGATLEQRASFFGAEGRLADVDRRTPGHRIQEEYRYDALGRRVWTRTRITCAPPSDVDCALTRVRRTIWDGGQELAEIQVPDTLGASENDSTRITVQPITLGSGFADPNPFFGRVLYTPGWQIDQPLSVTRFGYNDFATPSAGPDTTWTTFTIFPQWDTRGVPTLGTFGDGAVFRPKGTVVGQTQCPMPYTDSTNRRCVFVTWPGGYSAYDQRRGLPPVYSWHGSLLENKRDAAGFEYKRNRMYDPASGRFTQEDPIGLAGGLNLYGFANSDPVNFSDPFGLCIDENGRQRPCKVEWAKEASDKNITKEMKTTAQDIADKADVDLVLSSGRRAAGTNCATSLHDCGNAVDVKSINGLDVGQGSTANQNASALIRRVQGVALGMSAVQENFGPMGLWKASASGSVQELIGGVFGSVSFFPNGANWSLWNKHQNHIHIGIFP